MNAVNESPRWVAALRAHPVIGSIFALCGAVALVLGGLGSWATITGQPLIVAGNPTPTATPTTVRTNAPIGPPVAEDRSFEPHWAPVRATYSTSSLPMKPVLNSVTDNAIVGSELSFTGIRPTDPSDTADWGDTVEVDYDETLQMRITVNNDACPDLGSDGTIHGLRVIVGFDRRGTQTGVTAWLEGDNADVVSDSVVINHPKDVYIGFARDTASFQNATGWHDVPNSIGNDEWTALGSDSLDGEYGVGTAGSGWVLLTLWATRTAD